MVLLQKAPSVTISNSTTVTGVVAADTPVSGSKLEPIPIQIADVEKTAADSINKDPVWVHIEKCTMLQSDKQCLLTPGCLLNDKHINTAQALLRKQFTNASGLRSTLFQYKMLPERMTNGLQVIHCNGCHWVTAHKEDPSTRTVRIFDFVYESVENLGDISKVVHNLFESPGSSTLKIDMAEMQKQSPNSNNCGLFAVAVAMAILLDFDPSKIIFKEDRMRSHLYKCFEENMLTMFPCD